jgi:hypothetical protein
MSQLLDAPAVSEAFDEEPQILSFSSFAPHFSRPVHSEVQDRARIEFHNRCCPLCRRATVESIELRDGLVGRNGAMIPGTGTLVGFSCNACGHEWPSSE